MNPSVDHLSLALFLLRILLGVVFFAHGAQKVFGWFGGYGLTGTVGYFKNVVHVPTPLAYLGPFVEFAGGIALAFGLFTKFAAFGILRHDAGRHPQSASSGWIFPQRKRRWQESRV